MSYVIIAYLQKYIRLLITQQSPRPIFYFYLFFLLLSYVEWFLTAIACKGPPRYLARSLFYIPSILSTVQKWRVLFIGNIKHLMNGHE